MSDTARLYGFERATAPANEGLAHMIVTLKYMQTDGPYWGKHLISYDWD